MDDTFTQTNGRGIVLEMFRAALFVGCVSPLKVPLQALNRVYSKMIPQLSPRSSFVETATISQWSDDRHSSRLA